MYCNAIVSVSKIGNASDRQVEIEPVSLRFVMDVQNKAGAGYVGPSCLGCRCGFS